MYKHLKKTQKEMKDNIDILLYIKQNLEIYNKDYHKNDIKRIVEIISRIKNGKIREYYKRQ